MYTILDIDNPFSPAYGIQTFPKNLLFFRGYNPQREFSNYPTYYGSQKTADKYTQKKGRKLGIFTNKTPLRIMDIRFMKTILQEVFDTNVNDTSSLPVILSFGLSSLYHQLRLMKLRYKGQNLPGFIHLESTYNDTSIYEQRGVRIGETTNDAETMGFLQSFFDGFADGYISPRTPSPFHLESGFIDAELILFSPMKSNIRLITDTNIEKGIQKYRKYQYKIFIYHL